MCVPAYKTHFGEMSGELLLHIINSCDSTSPADLLIHGAVVPHQVLQLLRRQHHAAVALLVLGTSDCCVQCLFVSPLHLFFCLCVCVGMC